jgi:hypothetical protein
MRPPARNPSTRGSAQIPARRTSNPEFIEAPAAALAAKDMTFVPFPDSMPRLRDAGEVAVHQIGTDFTGGNACCGRSEAFHS